MSDALKFWIFLGDFSGFVLGCCCTTMFRYIKPRKGASKETG